MLAVDLDFEDHRKNQRPLGSLLVNVAFEIDANFFLDDRPVGSFLGVGIVDSAKHDVPGADDQVAVVVAHKTA